MRKNIFLFLIGISISASSLAATDYKCKSDCLQNGYLDGYCNSTCSYGDNFYSQIAPNNLPNKIKQTDNSCLSDCRRRYSYSYCQSNCSY